MQINSIEELQQWIDSLPQDKHDALVCLYDRQGKLINKEGKVLLSNGNLESAKARNEFITDVCHRHADYGYHNYEYITLMLLSRQYYRDDPEFDLHTLNKVIQEVKDDKYFPLLLSKCFKYPEWKMLIKHNMPNFARYETEVAFQLSIILDEGNDTAEIPQKVIDDGRYNYKLFISEDTYKKMLTENLALLATTIRNTMTGKHLNNFRLLTEALPTEIEVFFNLEPKTRLKVMQTIYEYYLVSFCNHWLSIDLSYVKVLWYMLLDSRRDDRQRAYALNDLINAKKANLTKVDDTDDVNIEDYRFSRSIRQLLLAMRVCMLRKIPKSCESLLGNALFFIKLHDFDFIKVYDSMYGKKKSTF